jgi:cytochrome c
MRKLLLLAPAALIGASSILPAAGTQPDGAALFRQRCASCHNMAPGARAVLGPTLIGVAGRKAGSTAFNYSPALKASNITWTEASLNQFLSGPTRMVPGTRMVISVSDPAQRSVIVKFIVKRPQS